jgi:hypothetical protein
MILAWQLNNVRRQIGMDRIFESLKRAAVEYYLFCVLTYVLIASVWYKYATWFSYKDVSNTLLLPILFLVVLLIVFGAVLKERKPKLTVIAWLLQMLGVFLQTLLIIKLYGAILTNYIFGAIVLMSIIVSVWSILANLNGLNAENNKLLGKKIMKHFLLTAITFVIAVFLMGEYFGRKVADIVSSGSLYVQGGLNSEMMERMIDAKIWQANLLLSLLTVITTGLFFVFYRRVKNSL